MYDDRAGPREPDEGRAYREERLHNYSYEAPDGRGTLWLCALIVCVALLGLIIGFLLGSNGW